MGNLNRCFLSPAKPLLVILFLALISSCSGGLSVNEGKKPQPSSDPESCTDSQTCLSILADAIGIYRGESPDGSVLTDSSGQLNDANLGISSMLDTAGFEGAGLSFTEGASERLTLADSPLINPDNLSISFWFKTPGATSAGFMAFAAKHDPSSSRSGFMLGLTWSYNGGMGYVPWIATKNASNTTVCSTKQISDNLKDYNDDQWHHVVANISFVNGGTTELYVNGALFDSCTNTDAVDSTGFDLLFGDAADGYWRTLNGKMDEIYLWNRTLSSEEALHLYEKGLFY